MWRQPSWAYCPFCVGQTDYNLISINRFMHSRSYKPDSSLFDYSPDRFLIGPVIPEPVQQSNLYESPCSRSPGFSWNASITLTGLQPAFRNRLWSSLHVWRFVSGLFLCIFCYIYSAMICGFKPLLDAVWCMVYPHWVHYDWMNSLDHH